MKLRIEMQQMRKGHAAAIAAMDAKVNLYPNDARPKFSEGIVGALVLDGALHRRLETSQLEVAALQSALTDSSATFADLHAEVAAQGDAIETSDAELKDERAKCDRLKRELVQMKEILAQSSKEAAGAGSAKTS